MGSRRRSDAGFTLFEMIISVAVIGIMSMAFVPSLINPSDVRSLDSGAREIMSSLQLARWQAGAAKLNHRVRFFSQSGRWWHIIEIEAMPGTWAAKPGQPARSISTKFAFTTNLPASSAIVFSPTGFVSGYDSAHSQISLSSAKLNGLGQPSRRLIQIFTSGSLRMTADSGGGA